MSHAVVHELEVVEVQVEQREGPAAAALQLDGVLEPR